MHLLLTTVLPHTFIATFVWQDPLPVHVLYVCYMFVVHYLYGLGSNLFPIYLLSLAGGILGYLLVRCTTVVRFMSRCNWGRKLNVIFIVKLLVLFVIYNVFELYGPTPWTVPLLFVAIILVTVLAWIAARNYCVLVPKRDCKRLCKLWGDYEYFEKTFCHYALTPALWLLISIVVLCVVNCGWLLVLFNIRFITPLRIQCLAVCALICVLVVCCIIISCNNGKKHCKPRCEKKKHRDCENPCGQQKKPYNDNHYEVCN